MSLNLADHEISKSSARPSARTTGAALLGAVVALLLASGCVGSASIGADDCFGPGCQPQGNANNAAPNNPSSPTNPSAPAPVTPNQPTCTQDTDCTAPYVCNTAAKTCVPPQAKNGGLCDPIEGIGCPTGEQCIGGVCQTPPTTCTTNDNCPGAFICKQGMCVPDGQGGQAGCKDNSQCPQGQACVGGSCVPQASCNVPHSKTRMAGVFQLDSKLHVRDGLKGLSKGLLGVAGTLQSFIDGNFKIKGLPSIFSAIVGSLVQGLIKQHVPPWGLQVIQWLSNVNDVLDDWRVVSTETISSLGNDQYKGTSTWNLVEFEYQGQKISTNGTNVPGLGQIQTYPWTGREVCGVFFIDKHKLKNKVGSIFRWAIEAMLTGITCSRNDVPCYKDLNTMFQALIDCDKFGQAVQSADQTIPGLSALVTATCVAQKQNIIKTLLQEIDDLAAKMTYMSLRAKANIINNNTLSGGRWYGTLGNTLGGGNFEGNFTGVRR